MRNKPLVCSIDCSCSRWLFRFLLYTPTKQLIQLHIKYIEDIQIFGMNMPFISLSEANNAYFMTGEATNEIYIFSLHEMK